MKLAVSGAAVHSASHGCLTVGWEVGEKGVALELDPWQYRNEGTADRLGWKCTKWNVWNL